MRGGRTGRNPLSGQRVLQVGQHARALRLAPSAGAELQLHPRTVGAAHAPPRRPTAAAASRSRRRGRAQCRTAHRQSMMAGGGRVRPLPGQRLDPGAVGGRSQRPADPECRRARRERDASHRDRRRPWAAPCLERLAARSQTRDDRRSARNTPPSASASVEPPPRPSRRHRFRRRRTPSWRSVGGDAHVGDPGAAVGRPGARMIGTDQTGEAVRVESRQPLARRAAGVFSAATCPATTDEGTVPRRRERDAAVPAATSRDRSDPAIVGHARQEAVGTGGRLVVVRCVSGPHCVEVARDVEVVARAGHDTGRAVRRPPRSFGR